MLGTEIKVFNQEDWNGLVPAPFPTGLVTCPVTSLFGFTIVLILTFTDGQRRSENLLKRVQNVVSQHFFFFGRVLPAFSRFSKGFQPLGLADFIVVTQLSLMGSDARS